MKKNFMILAAAAACFGLLTVTGCEETNSDDNEQTGNEISINKVWVSEDNSVCFDISTQHPGFVVTGFSGLDSDPNIYIDYGAGYKIESSTESEDKTSGTISIIQDPYGDGSTTFNDEISYSNLTEESVSITVKLTDPMSATQTETSYSCKLAPESIKVYTMPEYLESQMPTEGTEE